MVMALLAARARPNPPKQLLAVLAAVAAAALGSTSQLVVLSAGMVPILLETIDQMRENGISALRDADLPALLACQLAICIKGSARAGLVILLMLTGGASLEDYAFARAGKSLHSLLERGGASVAHKDDGTGLLEDVPAETVAVGDELFVKHGGEVPVDGVVSTAGDVVSRLSTADEVSVAGSDTARPPSLSVDESLLTGERVPCSKTAGDAVLGGSRNLGAAFRMRATSAWGSSVLAVMQAKLREALDSKAPLEISARRLSGDFNWLAVALAGAACAARPRARPRASPGTAVAAGAWLRVLAVLMSATPCPAAIGVPVAMISGMSRATRLGARIKTGAAIEALARVDLVVLDKTGTVTHGDPSVKSFVADFGLSEGDRREAALDEEAVLRMVCSVERLCSHPLAGAICRFQRCGAQDLPATCFEEDARGGGVSASVTTARGETFHVRVGARSFVADDGFAESDDGGHFAEVGKSDIGDGDMEACFCIRGQLSSPKKNSPNDRSNSPKKNSPNDRSNSRSNSPNESWISPKKNSPNDSSGVVATGRFTFHDRVRDSAAPLVASLREMGIAVAMLSGDRSAHLGDIASELGISDVHRCWPGQKADFVSERRAQGRVVLVVGDGANDAAALAAADVGMSVGDGAAAAGLASESASVVLMHSDLDAVARLVRLSRGTVRIATRTVHVGMLASVAQMVAAALGLLPPLTSAVLQECVDLTALVHSLGALFQDV